jgi:hypothetical protein
LNAEGRRDANGLSAAGLQMQECILQFLLNRPFMFGELWELQLHIVFSSRFPPTVISLL